MLRNFILSLVLIILSLISQSCTSDYPSKIPTIEVNPLRESYIRNSVQGYLTYFKFNDYLELADSVRIDTSGNVISSDKFGGSFRKDYDLDNNLLRYEYLGCVYSINIFEYNFDRSKNLVEKWRYSVSKEDTVVRDTTYILMNDKMLPEKLFSLNEDNDTSYIVDYLYLSDTLIWKIESEFFHIEYKYKEKTLVQINFKDQKKVDFLSDRTGLIDSTLYYSGDSSYIAEYYKYF